MKKTISLLLALLFLLSAAGCSNTQDETQDPGDTNPPESDVITVTDHLDKQVTVPADIERIAVVGVWPLPSVLTIFFNSAEKIVGMPEASLTAAQNGLLGELYPEILNAKTDFINGDDVNLEELMLLEPDVVFYNAANPAVGEKLTNAGFAAVAVSVNKWDYDCIETLNNWIELFSTMFPKDAKSDAVEKYSNEVYDLINERVSTLSDEQRARVFFIYQYTDTMLASSGAKFFGQWWCDAVGAINVAQELTTDNSVEVNMEQVYAWNPDTIIVTNFTAAQPEDLMNNTIGNYDWSTVAAIQNGRVFKMPLGMYRSYTPGADTPVTLLWLAKSVYPELFEDIDITERARSYYKDVFGVELTDEQIASIFTPTSAAAGGAGA